MGTDGLWLTLDSSVGFDPVLRPVRPPRHGACRHPDQGLSADQWRVHPVFLGDLKVGLEIRRGLLLLPALWVLVVAMVSLLSIAFPNLHNVPTNLYGVYMDTPLKAGIFIVVVVLAGGVREELQRAFILHRFQHMGGVYVGTRRLQPSAFGLLDTVPQGFDVAIAVGVLGVIWGLIYIRRRSVVAPMVSHAGFDVVQVLQQVLLYSLGR